MRCVVRWFWAGLLAGLYAVPVLRADGPSVPAGDVGVSIEKIEAGFRGWSKVGEWTPLWITLKSANDQNVSVVVDVPDPDDNLAEYPSRPVELKAGVPSRVEMSFRSGRIGGDVLVRITDGQGRKLAARRLSPSRDDDAAYHHALKLETPLWIALGKLDLEEVDGAAGGTTPRVIHFNSLADLPARPRALQSIEMLILPTGREAGGGKSLLEQYSADHDAVLRAWVRGGGHLLVSVAAEAAAYQKSPLAAWDVPVKVESQILLRQLATLESFSGTSAAIKLGPMAAARLSKTDQANTLVRDSIGGQPLVASVPYGFGRVTLIALDIDAPPLAGWKGLVPSLQKIAGTSAGNASATSQRANRQLTHVGVSDLATQFQQTHEDFPAISRPSYWSVMGLILLYVAVIGPLDYFLVNRVLRRPELTWFTFVVLVAAGIVLAEWTARRVNGPDLQVNQFDLVDIDAASGTTRNNTWASLYSPEHRRYSVAVEPLAEAGGGKTAVEVAWLGVPENSVGGLYRPGGGSIGGRGYRFAIDSAAAENLPVAHWSTKSVSAVWNGTLDKPVVDCQLENLGTGQLRGSLTLLLDEPLEDCMLVANGWAYIPTTAEATLKPHVEWQLRGGREVRQRDLKALLTGEKQTRRKKSESQGNELTTTVEPYQPLGRNRSQQVAMITFHEATGGSSYTGLANAALRDLELTELMQLGRAILVGRVTKPRAQILVDGIAVKPADQATWVRLVLPVTARERIIEKNIPKASERVLDSDPSTGGKP